MQIKDELAVAVYENCGQPEKYLLFGALLASARFTGKAVVFSTTHRKTADRLRKALEGLYGASVVLEEGSKVLSLHVDDEKLLGLIAADMREEIGFDYTRRQFSESKLLSPGCQSPFLAGVYLACGSVSHPRKAYHMEFFSRRKALLDYVSQILRQNDIDPGYLQRENHHMIYLKESGQISDFLLISGAHNSMLQLESLMVDKSVMNTVNRMMNCDSANIDRIMATGERQKLLVEDLKKAGAFDLLPEKLKTAAKLRLENPDLSIKDLGELMDPPLGKSGMSHRLKNMEDMARRLLDADTDSSG